MTAGQSDLMRAPAGLVPDFKKAGIDHTKVVSNRMSARLVPAMHSTLHSFPAAGFMLDIGGSRVYISGDTDLFSEMKTIGERYQPNLGIVCVGDGPHYAHNGAVDTRVIST